MYHTCIVYFIVILRFPMLIYLSMNTGYRSYDIEGCDVGKTFFAEIYTPECWLSQTVSAFITSLIFSYYVQLRTLVHLFKN